MANRIDIKGTSVGSGDLVRVHLKVVEGDKERIQIFEGMVISLRGRGDDKTFTVRKIASGNIGVERIFPVSSPWISKLEVKKPGHVHRAKLGYVRTKSAKQVSQISKDQSQSV
ncbi:50S ribosomal protein L19 [Candidatus Amesbacteria bacterium RIFOXYB1_FULL_44_23]|uniref:50S ribosomal protein L19 n=1 Tax=Candidatus Amesbacteria bacterium RIFOXYB1_FULL_44_23 TaxID=1797263 RepID=A0A1F4ZWC4_9BACT|nr:MAG: 50S ribosomal protein L19 [Candidatus Amesbacteria bacterium RIFOXYB1_FULL_44_23]